MSDMSELKSYHVWDAPTRWFHWISVLCIIALMMVGLFILNIDTLGIPKTGKIILKTVHVWIGYVFVLNFLWRIVWAFIGNRFARWPAILPCGKEYFRALRSYLSALKNSRPERYLGHNPVGRLNITLLFLLIAIQAVTGLVLAGTDLFYPPIGHWIAQWVAAPDIAPATLLPYANEMYDKAAYEQMRAFRKPIATVHLYSFYVLSVFVVLHVAAVIATEIKEGGNIISAMFTGRKIIGGRPVDEEKP